jgi:thymidylate synthase ThyX
MQYVPEHFTAQEEDVLRPYFTNLDGPVFALVNLPEVVKGALFARYSRSSKSLRRLFLDEFVGDLDLTGDLSVDATIGLRRAEELYDRVFFEYGDDSVAQLGGVHLACEQSSNLLTKVLEWGRLMAYLEQSTRYIPYDTRLGGRYRYWRDPEIGRSSLGARYIGDLDAIFDAYAQMLPELMEWARARYPKEPGDSDFVYKQTIKAKACDAARGVLPAATLSNVGIYGTGQAFEALLLRMRAHPLPEARQYAAMMLAELRKVIPSFLTRVDRPERGVAWTEYLTETRQATAEAVGRVFGGEEPEPRPAVMLTDYDPDGEEKLLATVC